MFDLKLTLSVIIFLSADKYKEKRENVRIIKENRWP